MTPLSGMTPSRILPCCPSASILKTDRQAWGATARLAEHHRLTLDDAAYLEVAQTRSPLATL